jgi:hypothetical protein
MEINATREKIQFALTHILIIYVDLIHQCINYKKFSMYNTVKTYWQTESYFNKMAVEDNTTI